MNAPRNDVPWTRDTTGDRPAPAVTGRRRRPLQYGYLSDPDPARTFRIHG